MSKVDVVKNRGKPALKFYAFLAEALVPVAVLFVALTENGVVVGSSASFAIALGYVMVASALKVFLVDVARTHLEEKGALGEFFVGSAIFYGALALGMLKLFELMTS